MWVRDVCNHLKAQGIISAILEPLAATAVPNKVVADALEDKNAKAIIIMIHHMDESLQSEYLNEKDPRRLWVTLEERFDILRESSLPDLEVKWQQLCFYDYASVLEYNSEALRIKSLMKFCQKNITDAMLIEKILSTFPVSNLVVS